MRKANLVWGFTCALAAAVGSSTLPAESIFSPRIVAELSMAVSAPTGVGIPAVVIKDSEGDIVGEVIDLNGDTPKVLLVEGGRKFPVQVATTGFTGGARVYYTVDDCTGAAYMKPPADESGWWPLIGATYGIRDNELFRVLPSDATQELTFESAWLSTFCNSAVGGTFDAAVVTSIDADLTTTFPPPYSAQ